MSRRGKEFSQRTRDQLFTAWHRDNPGNEDANIEIHHKLPIFIGKMLKIPGEILKSQANAIALRREEHRELHSNTTMEEWIELGKTLVQSFRMFDDE